MITTVYTIDNLTIDSVSIKKQQYYDNIPLGEPHRKAYVNSERGRAELEDEIPKQYVNAVFAVWGEKFTIVEE